MKPGFPEPEDFRNNGRIDAPDLARSRLVLPGRHRSFLRAFSARGRIERCRNNGRIVGSAEEAMGDATPGHACTAAAAPATGRAAPAGGPAGGRRRAAGAGVGEFGVAVVADVSARRAAGPAAHADPGPTAAVVRGTAAPAGEDPGAGSAPGWLPHGSLDPRAGSQGHPSGVRDSLSPQPCLEDADRPRLAVPAVRAVRGGEADA